MFIPPQSATISSCKVPDIFPPLLTKSEFTLQICIKVPLPNITKIRPLAATLIHADIRMDGRT